MKVLRDRKYLIALLALLVVFAACKGESPTAPTPNGGSGGGGGVTPPTGATIALTVSNPTPLVNSTSVISATVTQNNAPVPNGTAVEFHASIGTFTDTGTNVTIRTTTNGVATATVTSTTAGTSTITAIVNNVSRTTTVAFGAAPTTPPPTNTTPTVTGVSPTSGLATGGQTITITGTNFRTPLRVLFDFGNGVVKEGFVANVTPTQITVVTPAVDLGPGQTADATISVLVDAGLPTETRVSASAPFTFRVAQLTPTIHAVSPDQGPIKGGTRITIFGDGFESPVQVAFSKGTGFSAMEVVSVSFHEIVAITPTARDVNDDGSGVLTGPVDLRVLNINSNKSNTLTAAFRYTPAMQITGVRPLQGTALGGTDVTIDGIGFDPPVDVFIAGVLAQTIRVSGSQILARTSPLAVPCNNSSGPIEVHNINNGDSATSDATFTYIGVNPLITALATAPFFPGSTVTVTVQDPGIGPLGIALIGFKIAGQNVAPTPNQISVGTGAQTFTMVIPTAGIVFPTVTCTTASATPGTQLGPINVDVQFTNLTTGCSNTLSQGLTITPPGPNTCLSPPTAVVAPPSGTCAVATGAAVAAATPGTATFTISNAASSRDLIVGPLTATAGTNASSASVAPNVQTTIPAGTTQTFTVTVTPTAAGPFTANVAAPSNDPTKSTISVCVNGTAAP